MKIIARVNKLSSMHVERERRRRKLFTLKIIHLKLSYISFLFLLCHNITIYRNPFRSMQLGVFSIEQLACVELWMAF